MAIQRILEAARRETVFEAALAYANSGIAVFPCQGKSPAVVGEKNGEPQNFAWKSLVKPPSEAIIQTWQSRGWLESVAVICGKPSGGLVVIDLDGEAAIAAFRERFPDLCDTYTVRSGSGEGLHVYLQPSGDVPSTFAKGTAIGNVEVRSNGYYVIAPPSQHERTHAPYAVDQALPIKRVFNLPQVIQWVKELAAETNRANLERREPAKQEQPNISFSYGAAALASEADRVRSATTNRNETLYKAALRMGQLVAAGQLAESQVESVLFQAATDNGYVAQDGAHQARRTISSGLRAGSGAPRAVQPQKQAQMGAKTPTVNQQPEAAPRPLVSYEEQPPAPHDDQLADQVIDALGSSYRFFQSSWHKYEAGRWQAVKNINREVISVVVENRALGIKPTRARCQSVEWFVQMDLELQDDGIVDNYQQYINVKNGLFNLDTTELEPHQKEVMVTAQCNFEFDDLAYAQRWRRWLMEMLVMEDGQTDWKLIDLLQEAMGYTLTADTSQRVSFWVWGPTGSGKSTLINVLVALMGEYHAVLDFNQLAVNRFMLARAAGKRLLTFGEADAQTKLADGIYKMLVSSDTILADVKNREPIEFVPQAKIWWAMNNLPYISDRSGAVDSRVIILPMRRSVPREQWDLTLDDKLKEELPGIFNFAIEGLKRLRHVGQFTHVAQVDQLRQEYQQTNDVYASFLADEEWCIRGGRTAPKPLYKAFKQWAESGGVKHHATLHTIKREWERLGLALVLSHGRFYEGVTLTPYAEKENQF